MENESKKQAENIDNSTEKLLLSDVSLRSGQLVLFADWLQYNGKGQLPEEQVNSFLNEQKQN
jgi:hypothetical protein